MTNARLWFPDDERAKGWLSWVRQRPVSMLTALKVAEVSFGARWVCLLPREGGAA